MGFNSGFKGLSFQELSLSLFRATPWRRMENGGIPPCISLPWYKYRGKWSVSCCGVISL